MSKKLTTIPESSARLPTGNVAARYGVTTRSIDRWWKDPELAFPQPIYINDRKYWSLTDLERWERERARKPKADLRQIDLEELIVKEAKR